MDKSKIFGSRLLADALDRARRLQSGLLEQGERVVAAGREELGRAMGFNQLVSERLVQGGIQPALQALFELNRDVLESWTATLRGQKDPGAHVAELSQRVLSGIKYNGLISTLGKDLFGSARFEGERVLAENELMTLSYLPARRGTEPRPALFHVGGFLPFSDRIFRILPEANLFMHFLARGVPIYALELKPHLSLRGQVGPCTFERLIEIIDEMSDRAFEHAGRRPMIIEGYCGLAMPMLLYLAALPQRADAKFRVATIMVAPVDGRECTLLYDSLAATPRPLIWAGFLLAEVLGGYVPGSGLQASIDLPLGALFNKSVWGRFMAGWKNEAYAKVARLEDLSPAMRRELAGAYWLSPENCEHLSLPGDIARFSTNLWLTGIEEDLRVPYTYRGRPLSLLAIRDATRIHLVGFYGGKDAVVPESTAHVLVQALGERYTHVVHPHAGHISYVLSPEIWDPAHKRALSPQPIDLLLEHYQRLEVGP